jgi:hypothetical protein
MAHMQMRMFHGKEIYSGFITYTLCELTRESSIDLMSSSNPSSQLYADDRRLTT